jgi:hypothetical protein
VLSTEYLFRLLQLAGPATDAHAPEQGYVEVGIDPPVEVTPGWRNSALPLQHTEMLRSN